MEEFYDTVKERLILCGISELENNGIDKFSLRRVASMCNVSCAAPYKHFKNKEEFIFQIAKYIFIQWNLLTKEIIKVFDDDKKRQITEVCISYIKFWLANPKFRSVLMINNKDAFGINADEIGELSSVTKKLITAYYQSLDYTEEEISKKVFAIRSLIYGAIVMLDKGEIENDENSLKMIRENIEYYLN